MAGMLTAVIVYMSALVLVSAWRSRRVRTGDDFLVAGRRLPARVLVFTLLATWIGSGSLFGGAGLGYRSGFSALWQSAGAWTGIALVYFIAPRVRRIAQYTVPGHPRAALRAGGAGARDADHGAGLRDDRGVPVPRAAAACSRSWPASIPAPAP